MPIIKNAYGYKAGLGKAAEGKQVLLFSTAMNLSSVPPIVRNVNLTKWMPPCYDQKQTSSCVLNAWAAAVQYGQTRSGLGSWTPSRLFAYWNARTIEGDTNIDGGSYIHDAFHQGRYIGIISEDEWVFDESKVLVEPDAKCFDDAKGNQIHYFASVDTTNLNEMKLCIAHSFPIVFGFRVPSVFESQEFAQDPQLHLPASTVNFIGGHGVCAVGFDDDRKQFLIRNSWGSDWGENGYFWMDYDFMISNLVSDGWMLRFTNQETSID